MGLFLSTSGCLKDSSGWTGTVGPRGGCCLNAAQGVPCATDIATGRSTGLIPMWSGKLKGVWHRRPTRVCPQRLPDSGQETRRLRQYVRIRLDRRGIELAKTRLDDGGEGGDRRAVVGGCGEEYGDYVETLDSATSELVVSAGRTEPLREVGWSWTRPLSSHRIAILATGGRPRTWSARSTVRRSRLTPP